MRCIVDLISVPTKVDTRGQGWQPAPFNRFLAFQILIYHQKLGIIPTDRWQENFERQLTPCDFESEEYRYTMSQTRKMLTERVIFLTKKGRVGLGSAAIEPGDDISLLFGGRCPYVIRPCVNRRDDSYFHFVGECFIYGLMNGEGLSNITEEDERYFVLV